MTTPAPTPVEVSASPVNAIAGTIVRYLLQTLGGILVAKGFLDQPTADAVVLQLGGLLLTFAPAAWGVIRTKLTHAKLVTAADAAPNDKAVVVH